jgi:hypothetical protein
MLPSQSYSQQISKNDLNIAIIKKDLLEDVESYETQDESPKQAGKTKVIKKRKEGKGGCKNKDKRK